MKKYRWHLKLSWLFITRIDMAIWQSDDKPIGMMHIISRPPRCLQWTTGKPKHHRLKLAPKQVYTQTQLNSCPYKLQQHKKRKLKVKTMQHKQRSYFPDLRQAQQMQRRYSTLAWSLPSFSKSDTVKKILHIETHLNISSKRYEYLAKTEIRKLIVAANWHVNVRPIRANRTSSDMETPYDGDKGLLYFQNG